VAFTCREGHRQGDLVPFIHVEQAAKATGEAPQADGEESA
jgi:hypothetical protein